jgi:polyphosphate kinase
VRVATLTRLTNLNEKAKELLGYNPKKLLTQIKNIVVKQEQKFNNLYENIIVKQLADEKIFLINDTQLNVARGVFVKNYFRGKAIINPGAGNAGRTLALTRIARPRHLLFCKT